MPSELAEPLVDEEIEAETVDTNEQSAVEAEPTPPLTPSELRALHYQQVIAMGHRVEESRAA